MDALVEAHDARELDRAVALGADPIGDQRPRPRDVRHRPKRAARARRTTRRATASSSPRARSTRAPRRSRPSSRAPTRARRHALMRAADPRRCAREPRRAAVVKVCGLTRQEDVDAAVDGGRRPLRVHLSPRAHGAADAVLDVGESARSPSPCSSARRTDTDADLVQLYEREEGRVRGRDAVLLRDGAHVATVVDLPWEEADPTHLDRARRSTAGCARRRPRPRERRARRSRPCGRGPSTRARASSRRRASRITSACARSSQAARMTEGWSTASTAAATCRRRSCPALDELEAGWQRGDGATPSFADGARRARAGSTPAGRRR